MSLLIKVPFKSTIGGHASERGKSLFFVVFYNGPRLGFAGFCKFEMRHLEKQLLYRASKNGKLVTFAFITDRMARLRLVRCHYIKHHA